MSRISSLDAGYVSGDLSVYPHTRDDVDQLYEAQNNAETLLRQSVTYNAKQIVVEDASNFPVSGLIRVGPKGSGTTPELIYYGSRTNTVFSDLVRGFAGSRQNTWPAQHVYVSNAVLAEHHNAVKDAILNIQKNIGLQTNPDAASLNGILKAQETRFLAPKAVFRAFPISGPPGTSVHFHNYSEGGAIRYLWDFGDGSQSIEQNPDHVYQEEGIYTVKLNIITVTGAQGSSVKSNYITINTEEKTPFFYAIPTGNTNEWEFIDQTDADIQQRYWLFDDGTTEAIMDPNEHTIKHTYPSGPKTYNPSLVIVYADSTSKRVFLNGSIQTT